MYMDMGEYRVTQSFTGDQNREMNLPFLRFLNSEPFYVLSTIYNQDWLRHVLLDNPEGDYIQVILSNFCPYVLYVTHSLT